MLQFAPLTLGDRETVRPYYSFSQSKSCDLTPGASMLWRDFFQTEFALYKNTLILKACYDGEICFPPPIGENPAAAAAALADYCRAEGIPLRFNVVSEDCLSFFLELFEAEFREEPDWADYIYAREDLAGMRGRKYNGQRNHINYFNKTWPDWRYEDLGPENLGAARTLFDRYEARTRKDAASFAEEMRKTRELLDKFEAYGLSGGVILADGRAAAFAAGEIIGDTLFVHVEKADTEMRGAYPMIIREFARRAPEDTRFINREDDGGDLGLRKAKMDTHPIRILRKYKVLVKNGSTAGGAE